MPDQLLALADEYPMGAEYLDEIAALADHSGPWLLVERNVGSSGIPPFWLTRHDSVDAARNYYETQDAAEDWIPVVLVRLADGTRFPLLRNLTFTFDCEEPTDA